MRFYGFDGPMEMAAAPSPREYVLRLHAAVVAADGGAPVHTAEIEELAGADARWTDESAMYHAERSVGRTPEADRLRLLADDLCAAADACGPALAPSGESRFRVAADARTAVGLLRYHAIMATDTPDRLGRLSAQRDAMMGANLLAIAEREAGRGPTVVFAHNLHLQREPSEMRMGPHRVRWFSAGAQAAARLGGAYRFVPMAIGAAPAHGLGAPAPGTVEGELYRHQTAAARLYRAADLAGPAECATERTDRDARGAYFPLAPEHLADADGVLFLREVRA
ncbi:erythromycin esterase family protein [Tsukamurella sp. PLM1]|uniref:erythromycin esterase family protein n=1 Tax=Tsukamurella sp. PLM1 TaxID=2929795 RepID=UPI00204A2882|nr:hypothetical protein MTP03_12180 [Tsukamurella sp. PLM1]